MKPKQTEKVQKHTRNRLPVWHTLTHTCDGLLNHNQKITILKQLRKANKQTNDTSPARHTLCYGLLIYLAITIHLIRRTCSRFVTFPFNTELSKAWGETRPVVGPARTIVSKSRRIKQMLSKPNLIFVHFCPKSKITNWRFVSLLPKVKIQK